MISLIRQQAISFVMALREDCVQLSISGILTVGMDLIPSVNSFV